MCDRERGDCRVPRPGGVTGQGPGRPGPPYPVRGVGEKPLRPEREDDGGPWAPRAQGRDALGLDVKPSAYTDLVGSIVDRNFVEQALRGVDAVLHTATLHKPHVATHTRQDFIDTNITGTHNLLDAAVAHGARAFVFTSTTSAFGDALSPAAGEPAVWITEDVMPVAKNIYGATKLAAEDLCRLAWRNQRLPCLVLRTSRFFPEPDDNPARRNAYADMNIKVNEFLHRRAEVQDLVDAHLLAIERAEQIGFDRYILSATTPFTRDDLVGLRQDAPSVVARYAPGFETEFTRRDWRMFPQIERVYVNTKARQELGWQPRYDFAYVLDRLRAGEDPRSPLAQAIGRKGYHAEQYADGIYPV